MGVNNNKGHAVYQNIKTGEIQILEMPCKGWRKVSYNLTDAMRMKSNIKYKRIK